MPKMSRSYDSTDTNGYMTGWYECNCCPYGYHIDLDFVRYCESIERQTECTGSIKRRKDRRRQRQSMEVLLGLTPPPPLFSDIDHGSYKPIKELESPLVEKTEFFIKKIPFVDGSLDDVVNDFERTLQRSKKKFSHNLPDVTAVTENLRRAPSVGSVSSEESASSLTAMPSDVDAGVPLGGPKDFDTISVESCGLSPAALHHIREQMALSLERTRQLEEQVKIIPALQNQILALKEEKRQLQLKQSSEEMRMNRINGNYLSEKVTLLSKHGRSQSFTNFDKKEPPPPPPRRDFGVMCGVLTRNVGVGHLTPNTKTVATDTPYNHEPIIYPADKWLGDKIKFLNINENFAMNDLNAPPKSQVEQKKKPIQYSQGTQTIAARDKRDEGVQTLAEPIKITLSKPSQTIQEIKRVHHVATTVSPVVNTVSIQNEVATRSVGVSDHTLNEILCSKCKAPRVSTAVGPDNTAESHTSPICLSNLSMRSKSFNLGEDKLNLGSKSRRSVACQKEQTGLNKASQYESKSSTKSCQYEADIGNKSSQTERTISIAKHTDTSDLLPPIIRKHVACETKVPMRDSIINTDVIVKCESCVNRELKKSSDDVKDNDALKNRMEKKDKNKKEEKKDKEKDKDTKREEMPSRIPRPQIPTTPVENRKFKRQDTYTKIPAPTTPVDFEKLAGSPSPKATTPVAMKSTYSPFSAATVGLSGLDFTLKSPESTSAIDKVKQTLKVNLTPAQNGVNSSKDIQEIAESIAQTPRKKCVPSKEMQSALKVLNDHLKKSPSKNVKNQMKSAIEIVEKQWFTISSTVTANPLDVEDYLDCFEEISYELLQYIVNMGDGSGNTAMHYAVSHGNFDVVSILLDSKVCDINKQNKAGYTSIMLVSLAEIRSQTDANVVRRLFQLADVNIRAKQHGQTALMLAVSHGRTDMVSMLLEAGADINIQDDDGSTALMCAAEHGHIEIVKLFLSQPDCDTTIMDVDGSTALNIAMEAGHRHIGVLLYARVRNLQGSKYKKSKSTSASPKTPSSPQLPLKNLSRALPDPRK